MGSGSYYGQNRSLMIVLAIVSVALGLGVWSSARLALRQHEAETFPYVTGTVTNAVVTTTYGRRSTSYHARIFYRYSVDGTEYQGQRYRYDNHPTDQAPVNAIIAAHPRGSEIKVYYNPRDPQDACLEPGVDKSDVLLPLFLMFCIFFFASGFSTIIGQGFDKAPGVAGGVKIISDAMVTRVRLPSFLPIVLALWAATGLLVISLALVCVMPLPWEVGEAVLPLVGAGMGAVYLWRLYRFNDGSQDLVIDTRQRTVQLPQTYGRWTSTTVPFSELGGVQINPKYYSRRAGSSVSYMVWLARKDGSKDTLVNLSEEQAVEFAHWLRTKLGMPAEG